MPVSCVSAARGDGVAALLDQADAHGAHAGQGTQAAHAARAAPPDRTRRRRRPACLARRAGAAASTRNASRASPHPRDPATTRTTAPPRPSASCAWPLRDPLVRALGMTCTQAGPGLAEVRLTVGPDHLNFNGTCHGGVVSRSRTPRLLAFRNVQLTARWQPASMPTSPISSPRRLGRRWSRGPARSRAAPPGGLPRGRDAGRRARDLELHRDGPSQGGTTREGRASPTARSTSCARHRNRMRYGARSGWRWCRAGFSCPGHSSRAHRAT